MNEKQLQNRIDRLLSESGIPITQMCTRLKLATSSYYRWRNGELQLTAQRFEDMNSFLTKFGY